MRVVEEFSSQDQLAGLDDAARALVAGRVGEVLSAESTSPADRLAADMLAQDIARDVVEQVRCALSNAIRNASNLSRPLAMMLAHDVDSVACPFLEVTEVFTEADWQSLILTISRNARVSVARRRGRRAPHRHRANGSGYRQESDSGTVAPVAGNHGFVIWFSNTLVSRLRS